MADDATIEPSLPGPGLSGPNTPRPVRARAHEIWIAAAAAFVLGLAVAGGLGWLDGADFGHLLRLPGAAEPAGRAGSGPGNDPGQAHSELIQNAARDELALAGRVAAMEQRLDRVDARVAAASGNAARAEALLVALAVRRVVERGAPLGYLADQLRFRFGDAQPHAVATIIAANRDPVPPGLLAARLDALAPRLTDPGRQTLWHRVMRELSDMFIVRRDRPAQSDASTRLDEARKALGEGRIDAAVAEVGHLSNDPEAANWSAAARRTRDVENALDLIDSTALLQPRQLRDAGGNAVAPIGR